MQLFHLTGRGPIKESDMKLSFYLIILISNQIYGDLKQRKMLEAKKPIIQGSL